MDWEPPDDWPQIRTVESHAGGEPLRVVLGGIPPLKGETMIEKRRFARQNHDQLRTALMWEPRGHTDMYGAILTEPPTADGDVGVLFTHNDGYSTMCGHGVIALGVVLPEIGAVEVGPEAPSIRLDTPAGRVTAFPEPLTGRPRRVSFENVPAYVADRGASISVEGHGSVTYDLAFGGAYYAYCEARQFDIKLEPENVGDMIRVARKVKQAIQAGRTIEHPTDQDLGFLYGIILTGAPRSGGDLRNVCVFADGEVDRSPTGTGVSGHLAIRHARGDLDPGDSYTVESVIGSKFTGRVVDTTEFYGEQAIVPEVEGEAHIIGTSQYTIDPADPFGGGFLLR